MPGERRTRRSRSSQTLLPLHGRTRPSHTFSFWYCDFKIPACNGFLFSLGNMHARFFRVWFAIGVVFSFVALPIVTMILLQEFFRAIRLCSGNLGLHNLSLGWLFGVSSWVSGFSISIMDAGIMVFSTLISVLVHEFGHAIAAASQGIQIEYFAVFLAVIFPGALVAFNYDLLQTLPHFTTLRIYCAGIWHNTVFCAVCSLTLIILPVLLYPFYIHGERPMVLSVSPLSPWSGYLSRGDIIMSLDGSDIHNPKEWTEKLTHLDAKMLNQSYYRKFPKISQTGSGGNGYCVPSVWVEEGRGFLSMDDGTSCPDDLAAFVSIPCCTSNLQVGDTCDNRCGNTTRKIYCFNPKDVIKCKKCGGWQMTQTTQGCQCLQDECCLMPVQNSGKIWVEVSVSRPLSAECSEYGRNLTTVEIESFGSHSAACLETFVFIGDVASIANSVKLSAYRPRLPSGTFVAYLPTFFEKVLVCTFHVSASLALLNSMPVFLLDGESILEIGLCYITWLDPRIRREVLRLLLSGGTLLFMIVLLRAFYFIFIGYD